MCETRERERALTSACLTRDSSRCYGDNGDVQHDVAGVNCCYVYGRSIAGSCSCLTNR